MAHCKGVGQVKSYIENSWIGYCCGPEPQSSNNNNQLSFVQSGSQILPFEDNYFDHVLALACLHHTEYPERYVEELKRVIKQNGTIIIAGRNVYQSIDKLYISGSDFILNKLKEDIPLFH